MKAPRTRPGSVLTQVNPAAQPITSFAAYQAAEHTKLVERVLALRPGYDRAALQATSSKDLSSALHTLALAAKLDEKFTPGR